MRYLNFLAGASMAIVASAGGAWKTTALSAEAKPGCESPESRQFDFWVGTWRVTEKGELSGRNSIQKIDSGCALLESWTDAAGSTGHSLNIYDARRRKWHQTWVDARGGLLVLEGELRNGSMVLEGAARPAKDGKQQIDRITWTPLPSLQVRQHWEVSTDGGAHWSTVFDGLYTREAADTRTQ
jgi:hypothetical protein